MSESFSIVFPIWCLILIGISVWVGTHTERPAQRVRTK